MGSHFQTDNDSITLNIDSKGFNLKQIATSITTFLTKIDFT